MFSESKNNDEKSKGDLYQVQIYNMTIIFHCVLLWNY